MVLVFIGLHIVKQLADEGHNIKVITRDIDGALGLKVCGKVGQVAIVEGDITTNTHLHEYIKNCDVVINAIGILHEKKQNFHTTHTKAIENLASLSKKHGIKKFIHISALGIDKAQSSRYARSKMNGEKSIRHAFPEAIILRPSVVFGPGDRFFNLFARLASMLWYVPLINTGKPKLQPVYVADLASLICKLVTSTVQGETYDVAGPKAYSLREILEFIMLHTNHQRRLIPLSYFFSLFIASILEFTPTLIISKLFIGDFIPIITSDNVRMMKFDNISDTKTLEKFGIVPKSIDDIVPGYIKIYNKTPY